jgi:GT2 family glycosyltransferase
MYDISIITVNFNSSDDTLEMIKSVKKLTNVNYEIIVIDNASHNDEYKKLQIIQNDTNVVLHRSTINLGFACGNILGVQKASRDSKYYFFLNNDTILINNVVDILFNTMQNNLDIGLISPQLYNNEEFYTTTFREFPSVSEKFFGKGFKKLISNYKIYNSKKSYKNIIDVGIVSGASLFCRVDAYEKVSGFDKEFFLYCEEEDISKRIKDANFRVCLEPKAKLIHLCGKSTKKNFVIEREFIISYFYLVTKHYGILKSSLLKLHITLKYFSKRKKDPIFKQLFHFCFIKNKKEFSLRKIQKEVE